jgi:hypothetical protein
VCAVLGEDGFPLRSACGGYVDGATVVARKPVDCAQRIRQIAVPQRPWSSHSLRVSESPSLVIGVESYDDVDDGVKLEGRLPHVHRSDAVAADHALTRRRVRLLNYRPLMQGQVATWR